MKRIISLFLILCLMLPLSSFAEGERFRFAHSAYPGLHDRKVAIGWTRRISGGGNGTLLITDENGTLLGQCQVSNDKKYGSIYIFITPDMPAGQTIHLHFQQGENTTLQDSALLAADARDCDGLRKVETDEKKIAITFDTSNGLGKLPDLLDLLDKLNAKCTFFIQGTFFNSNSEWAAEIHTRGHELANHSMRHPDMREVDFTRMYNEITGCNELIEAVTGQPVTLYRPPSGYYTYRDRAIGRALGCETILWTFDSKDGFSSASRSQVWKMMTKNSEPGAIILMHIYGKHTISVLEEYIPMMQADGYEFVTMTDLMLPGGVIDADGVMHAPAE